MNAELSLAFHGSAAGIVYSMETSSDLQNWTTEGVSLSGTDADGRVTASVPRDSPQRFLRLVVSVQN